MHLLPQKGGQLIANLWSMHFSVLSLLIFTEQNILVKVLQCMEDFLFCRNLYIIGNSEILKGV